MAQIEIGTSSREVQALQKQINTLLGKGTVKEDGTYDEHTAEKMALLQKKLGVGHTSGLPDRKTLEAIEDAMIPRAPLRVNGKLYWLTQEQYQTVMSRLSKKSVEAVQPYLTLADRFDDLWRANDEARKKNKLMAGLVDSVTGASFPSAQTAGRVRAAAKAIRTGAETLSLTPSALDSQSQVIRQAFAEMDMYRDTVHTGGEKLVTYLQGLKEACVVTLKIAIAVKTAPMSFGAQLGGAAGGGAYEALLNEIEGASTRTNVNFGTSAFNVFKGAAVDLIIAALMKNKAIGFEGVVTKAAAKVAEKAASKGGPAIVCAYLEKAIDGAGKATVEQALKSAAELLAMDKKVSFDDVKNALIGAFVGGVGGAKLAKYLADRGSMEKIARLVKPADIAKAMNIGKATRQVEEAITSTLKDAPGLVEKIAATISDPKEINEAQLDAKLLKALATHKPMKAAVAAAQAEGSRKGR